ncbi:hypothetical protein D9M69_732610 [compost metagenome]
MRDVIQENDDAGVRRQVIAAAAGLALDLPVIHDHAVHRAPRQRLRQGDSLDKGCHAGTKAHARALCRMSGLGQSPPHVAVPGMQ